MIYYNIKEGWKSQDGRILIRKEHQEAIYYKGGKRHYKKKKEKIYIITVDGKELPFGEERLKDAKEMALKQIKKNNQQIAQKEVSNGNGPNRRSEGTSPSIEREGEGGSQEITSGSTATTLSEEWP